MNITIREPGSALTHFIAMLLALCAAVPLLVRAAVHSGVKSLTAMTVFMISMVYCMPPARYTILLTAPGAFCVSFGKWII